MEVDRDLDLRLLLDVLDVPRDVPREGLRLLRLALRQRDVDLFDVLVLLRLKEVEVWLL